VVAEVSDGVLAAFHGSSCCRCIRAGESALSWCGASWIVTGILDRPAVRRVVADLLRPLRNDADSGNRPAPGQRPDGI